MAEELTPDQKKKRKRIMMIIAIIVFLLLATAVTVYLVRSAKKKKALKEAAKDTSKDTSAAGDQKKPEDKKQPAHPEPKGDDFPLVKGSNGNNVLYLQRALNKMMPRGYTKLKEDSDFGQQTYLAVVTWVGTKLYPVTQENWMTIMKKSNQYQAH